ncbi:MAG TPA: glycoside hydrolase family 3 C-terminal domain-containing protein, partial [Acidimicrobiales bacterium]|nr:glycoside hydrolase family 3 C-terminal domain-containing protein [Acidimicrobiales bacterium]
ASVAAGLDLEMPSTGKASPATIVAAVHDGSLDQAALDVAVRRVLELVDRAPEPSASGGFDIDAHHQLARAAAAEGAVLLKNDGAALPLRVGDGRRVAVIGEFARTPRYQGAGSSQVNPTRVDDALGALRAAVPAGTKVDFAAGYPLDNTDPADDAATLIAEAVDCARGADAVVVFAGLPASYESEGFDRTDLALPDEQLRLIEALGAARSDVVVVLANGSVVTVGDFADQVAAVLECWLGGQASGSAVADLVLGAVNPSGKLAESIPLRLEDASAYGNFPGAERKVFYGEGLFVGYRRYDSADVSVAYPFGFGLSYTTFAYSDLTVDLVDGGGGSDLDDPVVEVAATITNSGDVAGAEVVQLYVGTTDAPVPRPVRELRGFTKVSLEPGATERVQFVVSRRDLARWSTRSHDWVFDPGSYEVAVAASSRDLRLVEAIEVPGEVPAERLDGYSTLAEWLVHPFGRDRLITRMKSSPLGDLSPILDDESLVKVIGQFPLRRLLPMLGGAFTLDELDALIDEANTTA